MNEQTTERPKYVNLALTDEGQKIMADIKRGVGDPRLKITRIVTSSGVSDDPLGLTGLAPRRQQFRIVSATRKDGSPHTEIEAELTNEGVTEGYSLRQIGFYVARDPDAGCDENCPPDCPNEVLWRVSQFENPNWVPPQIGPHRFELKTTFTFITANASEVLIHITPNELRDHISRTIFQPEGVHGLRFRDNRFEGSTDGGNTWFPIGPPHRFLLDGTWPLDGTVLLDNA